MSLAADQRRAWSTWASDPKTWPDTPCAATTPTMRLRVQRKWTEAEPSSGDVDAWGSDLELGADHRGGVTALRHPHQTEVRLGDGHLVQRRRRREADR